MFPLYDENRSKTFPFIMLTLLALNVLVFWWELAEGFDERIFRVYGMTPAIVMAGKQVPTLITSLFIHADFWHIVGNMLYLFIFGDNVEDQFGHVKFLFLYCVFGIVGGLTHATISITFGGVEQYIPAVGASGAVAGILGAYVIFFPTAKIMSVVPSYFFFRIARVPALVFIGFWFILQIIFSGGSTSVAYMAHIGGFVTGLIIATLFRVLNREKRTRWY